MTALTQLHAWLASARAFLDGLYPGLSNALLALLAVFAVWLLKKLRPDLFAKLPPSVQALPALFVSGVLSALTAVEPTLAAVLANFLGGAAVGGAAAVGLHHMAKASPLPYGDPPKAAPLAKRISTGGLVLLALGSFYGAFFAVCMTPSCNPKTVADVINIADDIWKVAQVLCLADQKQVHAARSSESFAGLCMTEQQLAPYIPASQRPMLAATLARHAEPSDAGAP